MDHEAVYKVLMGGVLDAIDEIEQQNYGCAKVTLIKTLQAAEDICCQVAEETQVIGF